MAMKPHPKLRKTIKWGGAVVTVLLVVVWVGSGWGGFGWYDTSGRGFYIQFGGVGCVSTSFRLPLEMIGWCYWVCSYSQVNWWPRLSFGPGTDWILLIPLWMPAVLAMSICVGAWQRERLAHRRAQTHLCPKCNYDRTGLAAGAVCPECGAATTSS